MHSSTENIVEKLLGKVVGDQPYYTPQDLSSAGYPTVIVENIRVKLAAKIDEELNLQTVWSEDDDSSVKQLKKALKEKYYEYARIPAANLKEMLSEVVESTLKVYLQPRQYLAEVIFQEDEQLGYDEVIKRGGELTVYKHFGQALPRYMKKRDLDVLSKNRCQQLIEKLDANLIKTYKAEDWVKVLDLLRKLGDGKVNANLAAIFFEDKAMDEVAKALRNTVEEKLDRDRLIEIIADPDSVKLNNESVKEKTESGKANESSETPAMFSGDEEKEESRLVDHFADEEMEEEPEEPEEDENSFNRMFKEEVNNKPIFQEFEEDIEEDDQAEAIEETEIMDEPEQQAFDQGKIAFSEEKEDEKERTEERQDSLKKEVEEDEISKDDHEDELNSWVTTDDDTGEELFDSEEGDGDTGDEDEPIWQQFMSPEEKEALKREEESEEDEIITEEHIFEDEPIEDTRDEEEVQPKTKNSELKNYLLDKEPVFINELYRGDRNEYEESLSRIENQKSWNEASDFLEKNVFSAHQVDMFSEAAIDFTDRLQSYFDEYKS